MSWMIRYSNKYTGKIETITHPTNQQEAEAWTKMLAKNHGCKTVAHKIVKGKEIPVLEVHKGKVTHIIK